MIEIRQTIPNDLNEIWNIIKAVITTGDTYVFDPNSSKEKMLDYWYAKDKHTYTALLDEKIAGTFLIKEINPISARTLQMQLIWYRQISQAKELERQWANFH